MGPSGAGKTSFMSTLAGRATYGETSGKIFVNNKLVNDLGDYSDICSFVPQNDIMLPNFTVFELLFFYARLKLPRKTSNYECFMMTQEVINCLGLAHIRHSIIGDASKRGISGGQKKRVNVAMEMVGDPSLIFLDEPTSGLDSTTSNDVLNALKVMSKSNVNVILVLHQPSYQLFSQFDQVMLLGKGGRTTFHGSPKEAKTYFELCLGFECPEMMNPADFYMDVIDGRVHHVGHFDHSKTKKLLQLSKYDMYKRQRDSSDDEVENDDSVRSDRMIRRVR